MKREDFMSSFNKIDPDKAAEKRMLENILNHSGKEKNMGFSFRKAIPALGLVIVLAGGILAYDMMAGRNILPTPGYVKDNNTGVREDMIAPLINQFQIDGRHYILLSDDVRAEYGFPQQIDKSDIGDRVTTITKSVDPNLVGGEVYGYKPAGGEAVVAVKKDDVYRLFRFFTFESYNNNQDEDAIEYLKLFGIDKAEDIAQIQFIVHSEQSKIEGKTDIRGELTGHDEISQFYSYYSVLKNSSDKYFDRLFNFKPDGNMSNSIEVDIPDQSKTAPVPPDAVGQDIVEPYNPDSVGSASDDIGFAEDLSLVKEDNGEASADSKGVVDMGNTGSNVGATTPSQSPAGNALANPVTIRIYNRSGVFFETVYYKNMGFISRYEVNEQFAGFIEGYIR